VKVVYRVAEIKNVRITLYIYQEREDRVNKSQSLGCKDELHV